MNETNPPTWKLVPVTATPEMAAAIEATIDAQMAASGVNPRYMFRQDGDAIYAAALDAAPQPGWPGWSSATAPGPDGMQHCVAVPGMPSAARNEGIELAAQCLITRAEHHHRVRNYAMQNECLQSADSIRAHKSFVGPVADVGEAIHYPACWDTAAYPTMQDAMAEIGAFKCSECTPAPVQQAAPSDDGWTDANDICQLPPEGWYCTRTAGHDGPCAAHQDEPARELDADDHACIEEGMARIRAHTAARSAGAAPAQPVGLSEQVEALAEAARAAQRQLRQWMRDHGQDVCTQAAIKAIDAAILAAKEAP